MITIRYAKYANRVWQVLYLTQEPSTCKEDIAFFFILLLNWAVGEGFYKTKYASSVVMKNTAINLINEAYG